MGPPPCSTCLIAPASSIFDWSRFGPTVPFAPAAFRVWQPEQPAEVKIVLPSVLFAPPPDDSLPPAPEPAGAGHPSFFASASVRPATQETYVATASTSDPLTMFGGIPGAPVAGDEFGYLICIPTTLRI